MRRIAGTVCLVINVFVFVGCAILSFKGFPFALISFLGYFIMMTAVGTVFGVWFNPGVEHKTGLTKVLVTIIGVVLLYFGDWVITKGGLISFAWLTGDVPDSSFRITLGMISWVTGALCAVMGTHRDDFKS